MSIYYLVYCIFSVLHGFTLLLEFIFQLLMNVSKFILAQKEIFKNQHKKACCHASLGTSTLHFQFERALISRCYNHTLIRTGFNQRYPTSLQKYLICVRDSYTKMHVYTQTFLGFQHKSEQA